MPKRIFVGMSGGVDSSVAAALLVKQGHEVVGVYMKNWSQDLPGFVCPWKEDYQDAKRVAVQLGIEFRMYDFETQYRHKVVDYMIEEFQAGRTPNPDIMCNQEVKFKLFLETALEDGADLIATGHYARVGHQTKKNFLEKENVQNSQKSHLLEVRPLTDEENVISAGLGMAKDANKDQTYFLYRVTKQALAKTLFPLGGYTKPEVRALAKKFGLATATKKESMGICFVGKVGIKDFLQQYVTSSPGNIVDGSGQVLGHHDGAIFYTIGQRHGLDVGGGLPYYVTGKNMKKNEVYVTTNIDDQQLWNDEIVVTDVHWINAEPKTATNLEVRTRHRASLIEVTNISKEGDGKWRLKLAEKVRALTPGQSAVLYDMGHVLGGGIVI